MARKDVFIEQTELDNFDYSDESESRIFLESLRDELKLYLQIQRVDGLVVCYDGKQILSGCIQTLANRYNPKNYQAIIERAVGYLNRKHTESQQEK